MLEITAVDTQLPNTLLSDIFNECMFDDLIRTSPDHETLDAVLRDFAHGLIGSDPIRLALAQRELLRRLRDAGVVDAADLATTTMQAATPSAPYSLARRRAFRFLDDLEIEAQRTPDDLIEGLLKERSTALLFGPPDDGKTFVALGVALSIATGQRWCTRRVKKGSVLYVIAEGQWGFGKRVRAWKQHHGMARRRAGVVFFPEPLRIPDADEIEEFIGAAHSHKPSLIVIDTLARNMGDGDEDSANDMSRFIRSTDMMRGNLNCAVLILHHPTKTGRAERGSGALRGAVDLVIRSSRAGNTVTLRCEKSKDAPPFAPISLNLAEITLPDHETSCVLVLQDATPNDAVPIWRDRRRLTLAALASTLTTVKSGEITTAQWKTAAMASGVAERKFHDDVRTLVVDGYVQKAKKGVYRMTETGQKALGSLTATATDLQLPDTGSLPLLTAATATPLIGVAAVGAAGASVAPTGRRDTHSSSVKSQSDVTRRHASFAPDDMRDGSDDELDEDTSAEESTTARKA